jgi:hypothetical protein
MVAPTWTTPGCVQFLENRKRFHTAWVKTRRTRIEYMSSAVHSITDIWTCYLAGCKLGSHRNRSSNYREGFVFNYGANGWYGVSATNAQSFQMTDSVQLKLRQRANIMLKVCELAESYRPETDKAMTPEDELKVDEIYRLLSRAMDSRRPPPGSTISDHGL